MTAITLAPAAPAMPVQSFALSITKVATIADFEGPKHRYYVRNFKLIAKVAA
jgi:hypothetical protein